MPRKKEKTSKVSSKLGKNSVAHSSSDLAVFCKKKGFIYASSEIYGGLAGFYDYGHLGTLVKHKFQNLWRKYFLGLNQNYYEIETANIMHENVFKASGHLDNFVDPIVHCSSDKCNWNTRADHLLEEHSDVRAEGLSCEELSLELKKRKVVCPSCKSELKDVETMNMMFPVNLGVAGKSKGFLRPETAQSPYVNFKTQYELQRKKLPMGLALIGKAFRNEISPRNLTLRQREFTQAELQIFFNPEKIDECEKWASVAKVKILTVLKKDRSKGKEATIKKRSCEQLVKYGLPKFYVYHLAKIQEFYLNVLGFDEEKLRFYELDESEKAFYNKYHFDIEAKLNGFSWTEIGGLHYRTDHDLKGHQKVSKQKQEIFDEESKSRFIPHVLELSFGVDRNVYTFLDSAYVKNGSSSKFGLNGRGNDVLYLPSKLAPFFCAVFPLVKNKEKVTNLAKKVYSEIKETFSCSYDEASSIGRRYARADEIGIKFAITVDFESLEDGCVTIRDRNNAEQKRIKISEIKSYLLKCQ